MGIKGRISNAPIKLNIMFIMAILMAMFVFRVVVIKAIRDLKGFINMENMITVAKLNIRLKCASFLASFSQLKMP